MRRLLESGVPRSAVAKAFGIARQTLYKAEFLARLGWEPPARTAVVGDAVTPEPAPAPRGELSGHMTV